MDPKLTNLLKEQIKIMEAATQVLEECHKRVGKVINKENLSIEERESCEALTARFARLCDFLFQRVFRTLI